MQALLALTVANIKSYLRDRAALFWTLAFPLIFIGHAKLRPARRLHDKILYADAEMNRANWLTGVGAMAGAEKNWTVAVSEPVVRQVLERSRRLGGLGV